MLHATEVLGAETYDSFGNYVGRVKEMFIDPAEQPNRVSKLLLGRGQYRPLLARYDQIKSVAPARSISPPTSPRWSCITPTKPG